MFILMLLVGVTSFAREDDCDPSTNSPAQARKEACFVRCEIYYQKNPQSRPADKKHTCEDLADWVDRVLSPYPTVQDKMKMQQACGKGIIEALENIPVKIRLYLATIQKFGDWVKAGIQEHQQFMEECRKDISCKREVARFMVQYRQKNPDGSFVLSDAQVDQQIQNRDFLELAMAVQEQRSQMQRVCSSQLSLINRKLQPAGGDWNYELLAKRYDELQKWDPYCPIALKFNRPTPDSVDAESTKNFEFWDEWKTKIQCQSPEKNREGFCGGITELIADPANLIPAGGAAVKAGVGAVVRKTGVEVAERAVAREAGETALAKASAIESRATVSTKQRKISTQKELLDQHSTQTLTTTEQNKKWVQRANTVQKKDAQTFVEISNSVQKPCNDFLGKAMCDSINNRYFEKVMSKIDEMKNEFPGANPYTDWKSYRVNFDSPLTATQKAKLNEIFQAANKEIENELRELGISIPGKDMKKMFQAGGGQTADQADNTARVARDLAGENRVYWFDEEVIQKNGNSYVQLSEQFRQEVAKDWSKTGLLEKVEGTNKLVPNEKVMAWARKEQDTARLTDILNRDLGANLSKDQVSSLQNYLDFVDKFNPSVYSAERNFINVNNATKGAMSSDYAGMGAKNSAETAKALATASTYEEALNKSRLGEQNVTRHFKQLMEQDKKIIEQTLGTKKGLEIPDVKFSGDDGSTILVKNADSKTKQELIHNLSKVDNPGGRRFSFVNEKPRTDFDRNMLAKHGEDLEKYLRAELSGKMPRSTVDKVTFGIDMKGSVAGDGDVSLLIGNSRQKLEASELKTIHEAFERAVQKMNESEAKKSIKRNSTYRAAP